MTKRSSSNPTIRILVLGAAGVGKNCLESRFITSQYPPPYDPSLTLCSRRFYTLKTGPEAHGDTTDAQRVLTMTPANASSQRPASHVHPSSRSTRPSQSTDVTALPSPVTPASSIGIQGLDPGASIPDSVQDGVAAPCAKCIRKANTHLVEVINYPALQSARLRRQVHSRGEYDAVLLVYDVGDRKSFERIEKFYGEIQLGSRKRKGASHSSRKNSGRQGKLKNGGVMGFFGARGGSGGKKSEGTGGSGDTVVALVGNKADCDGDGTAAEVAEAGNRNVKDDVDDVDDGDYYALASFGESLFRDMRDSYITPLNDPRAFPILPYSKSTNTLNRWLQVGTSSDMTSTSAVREVNGTTREVNLGGGGLGNITTKSDESSVASNNGQRQVSNAEGEGLAIELQLQLPCFETSAKTGENVEVVFEAVVRSVLAESRRLAISDEELSRRCRQKHAAESKPTEGPRASGADAGAGAGAGASVKPERLGRLVKAAERHDNNHTNGKGQLTRTKGLRGGQVAVLKKPVENPHMVLGSPQIQQRQSIMARMRNVFMRSHQSQEKRQRETWK